MVVGLWLGSDPYLVDISQKNGLVYGKNTAPALLISDPSKTNFVREFA